MPVKLVAIQHTLHICGPRGPDRRAKYAAEENQEKETHKAE